MTHDKFSNVIYEPNDVINLLYQEHLDLDQIFVDSSSEFVKFEQHANIALHRLDPAIYNLDIKEFDQQCQNNWLIPDDYKNFDVVGYCLEKCKSDVETQRVLDEIDAFTQKNMMPVLRTLKYLVDTFRQHGVVWGVGRGSSVSSYVLFLIGVHKINSIKYQLDWREFLR